MQVPSKNSLARSCKKKSFFLAHLQDLARSCGILQESCRNFVQDSCKIPCTGSRKIPQDLARFCRGARKKDLFLQDLARAFLLGSPFAGFSGRDTVFNLPLRGCHYRHHDRVSTVTVVSSEV